MGSNSVRRWIILTVIFSFSLTFITFLHPTPALAVDYRNYANTNASFLNTFYDVNKGLWADRCPGTDIFACWWQSANQLTTTLNYMERGGSNDYSSVIANTYDKNVNRFEGQFKNNFIDDTGWWGLAWLLAYDRTRDTRYLNTAKIDADHMHAYWDGTCGGGVWWNYDRQYKNAITIELYIKLNAAYYNRTGNATYLTRAQTGWNWFMGSGMVNSQNLVNDGLNTSCQPGGAVWTYNQGVILGAAAELHRATGNVAYLDRAQQIATAAMQNLIHTGTGALRENSCESGDCGGDGPLFKGVFMRNLFELNARRYTQANINFMIRNADVIWANDRDVNKFGLFWSGPYTGTDSNRQSSALDAFNAAIQYTTSNNLARGRAINASGQCGSLESYSEATDGSTRTKWCAGGVDPWLRIDLGQNYNVSQFNIKHAGAGGENVAWNTRAFRIQRSNDGNTWTDVSVVTANTLSSSSHVIASTSMRYVRLYITQPEQGTGGAARIYEFEVIGSTGTSPTPTRTNTPQVPTNTPAPVGNIALNKPATASTTCNANEGPAKAVNGSVSGGNTDKWCAPGTSNWMRVDLGANFTVSRFVVKHAGAGGESATFNTRAFQIETSTDGTTWFPRVTVTANTASTSTHTIGAVTARYMRLYVTQPEQGTGGAARIYEFEVYQN